MKIFSRSVIALGGSFSLLIASETVIAKDTGALPPRGTEYCLCRWVGDKCIPIPGTCSIPKIVEVVTQEVSKLPRHEVLPILDKLHELQPMLEDKMKQ